MKKTYLLVVLLGITVLAMLPSEASAFYNPQTGRFLQRDPGPEPDSPSRVGTAGPAANGSFAQRDPAGQYTDGMNLYQYVKSNPVNFVDPSGKVVIISAGMWESFGSMERLEQQVRQSIANSVAQFDTNKRFVNLPRVQMSMATSIGWYEGKMEMLYREWVARKRADKCRPEQFVIIGHSHGASAIYNLIRKGTFGQYKPAYLGLIDQVLPYGNHSISGFSGSFVDNHYQTNDLNLMLRGGPLAGASREWKAPSGGNAWLNYNHMNIMKKDIVISRTATKAAQEYVRKVLEEKRRNPGIVPWNSNAHTWGW